MERLRTEMRDAAQDGRQDESGGDRLEDAAAGAVRSGKNRAVRKLERIRRKRRRTSGGPEKGPEMKGPEKKDTEANPETVGVREKSPFQGRRAARAAAEKRVVSSAASAVETSPPAKQNVQQAPAAGIRQDAAANPKAVAKGAEISQPVENVRQAPPSTRFPRAIQSSPAARGVPAAKQSISSGIPNGQTERLGNRVSQATELMGRLPTQARMKAGSGVKTAERTAGTLSKGAPPIRQAAQAPVGTTRKMAWAVPPLPKKQAAASAKVAAKTAVSTAKAAIAAIRNLVAALLAGGWMVLIVVIFLCLIGLLISSPFGIFFSGEDVNGDGRTMRVVMREINAEFSQKISEIEAANPHDELDVGGTAVNWRDVLAIYTVKFSTGSETPMEVVTLTPEKEAYLREVFWDMDVITYEMDTVTSTTESGTTDVRVLRIRITGKTQAEIAADYGFTPEQMEQLASLMDSQLDGAWRHLLYGTSGGNTDIVEVALSQVNPANDGGEKFWSWYGFSAREEWCACFVSWCANECGYLESGLIPRFASCTAGMDWFDVRGQWMDNTYLPQPGDIIFFDWDRSGNADHVGIVERAEGGMVYTVEGNSGNAVRQNIYAHDNPQIRGYGLPQYP